MKSLVTKTNILNILKIALSVFVCVYILIAPITVFPLLKQNQSLVNKQIKIDYMGIIELWNIDTFEGGSKSRTNFLEKQAISFEKKYIGTFIMVYTMSEEQAKLNLANGLRPDIVSFGIGIGDELIQSLIPLKSEYNVRSDLIDGGKCNGIQYAIPYLLGGYVLVNDNEYQLKDDINTSLGFGGASNNNASLSIAVNNVKANKIFKDSENIDSFNAYDKYLDKKFDTLLGTQRDLYRILNRIDKGNMSSRSFEYVSGFSDLVQYLGICTTDVIKQDIALEFITMLLSDKVQSSISDYNMFSTTNVKLYSSGEFANMEKALSKNLKTLNVFLTKEKLNEIKQLSLNCLNGVSNSFTELKKYLVG